MSERDGARARADHTIYVRVNDALYAAIARDAAKLDLSMADVIRLRLRNGRLPCVPDHAEQGASE